MQLSQRIRFALVASARRPRSHRITVLRPLCASPAVTTASRAGFLIQSISVLVPLLAFFSGEQVGAGTWAGCVLGILGASLLLLDGLSGPLAAAGGAQVLGDLLVLGACFFYALGTVRLSKYAAAIPDGVQLAAARQLAMAFFSLTWVAYAAVQVVAKGQGIAALWPGYADPASWALVLYVALITGALSSLLQTLGQGRVGAAQAQVIYSSTPLWSALFSMVLIGTDAMGPTGWVGGAMIVGAGLLASFAENLRPRGGRKLESAKGSE